MVTLKIRSRSPKSNHLYYITLIKYIKVGQSPLVQSSDYAQKAYSGDKLTLQSAGVTLKIRSRLPASKI